MSREQTLYYISLDLETSGFNGPLKHKGNIQGAKENLILQVAGKILDSDLNALGSFDYMVEHPGTVFKDACQEGNYAFHERNGFWDLYAKRTKTPLSIIMERIILFHIPNAIRENNPSVLKEYNGVLPDYAYDNKVKFILHGKSVGFDKDFINHQMPALARILSHQTADVSSIRTLLYPVKGFPNYLSRTASTHMAMDDVNAAIKDSEVLLEYMHLTMPEGNWRYLEDVVAHLKKEGESKEMDLKAIMDSLTSKKGYIGTKLKKRSIVKTKRGETPVLSPIDESPYVESKEK